MIIIILCFDVQVCKIIIATVKCAVKISFSYQKKGRQLKFIVHQTFFSNKTDIFLLIIHTSSLNLKTFLQQSNLHIYFIFQSLSSL